MAEPNMNPNSPEQMMLVQSFEQMANAVGAEIPVNLSSEIAAVKAGKRMSGELQRMLAEGSMSLMNQLNPEMMPEIETIIQADSAGGLIMIFILYMIITFGIFGTVLMMTQERKYEFGVVISIGMKKTKLMVAMVYETIFLSAIGILLGIALSRPIVLYFYNNPLEFPSDQVEMMENQGFEAVVPFMSSYDIPITHGLIIFFISLIICFYPILTIYKLNPIKAMKR